MKVVVIRSTAIFKDSRTTKLINELLNLGAEVKVLGWDRLDEYNRFEEIKTESGTAKIELYKQPCPYGGGLKNLFKSMKFQNWVKKKLRELDDDYIIHACDFDTAKPAFRAKKGKKFINDIFDYFSESREMPKLLKSIVNRCENKIINNADAVVICSEQRMKQIKECKPKKLYVVHNTPNMDMKSVSNDNSMLENNNFKVAYVGVLAEHRLIREILEESKNHLDIEFHIGGIGQLAEFVKGLSKIQSNIIYHGSMQYGEVLKLEQNCDVLFATYDPSIKNHKFSAPNKFYEAGALEKPIIVCKSTGVDELVEKEDCGLAIDYSAVQFFDAIIRLKNDKELYKKLSRNGNIAYNERYSWQIMSEVIRNMYYEVDKLK